MSGGFLDEGEMASKVTKDCVCPTSFGTSVPTFRPRTVSPQLELLTGPDTLGSTLLYLAWRCYNPPKCATYVCMCLGFPPVVTAVNRLH